MSKTDLLGPVTYVTYPTFCEDVKRLAVKIAGVDPDIIIGLPRSGMMAASLIATHLHLPLAEPDSWAATGQVWVGHRVKWHSPRRANLRAVLVDDSCYRGRTMKLALEKLSVQSRVPVDTTLAAVYAFPGEESRIDIYERTIPASRFFEWNLFNHGVMANTMLDIDGVLCYNSTIYDDDGSVYQNSLRKAAPLYLPRAYQVHTLITNRLNRWRAITEEWLAKYRVKCGNLVMQDYPTAQHRRDASKRSGWSYGHWKGQHYRDSDAVLMVESCASQAEVINEVARKPVICTDTGEVFQRCRIPT